MGRKKVIEMEIDTEIESAIRKRIPGTKAG
jgi:hypothetical protein